MIIHISGAQGSGKTTLGVMLQNKIKSKIIVKDLDELHEEFMKTKKNNYQQYIYDFINLHHKKHIIFTGLDADICLVDGSGNKYYDLKSDYNYYINIDEDTIIKQRFLRQVKKLYDRKEWFINTYLENKKSEKIIQDKILRYVNIMSWKEQMKQCNRLYKKRKYKFMNRDSIYNDIISKIM